MNTTSRFERNTVKFSRMLLVAFLMISIIACNDKESSNNGAHMGNSEPDSIILINPFEVPKGKLEESVIYWEACRDFLKQQPGYISTKLHQSIKDDTKFELINVAVWESAKAFTEASQKMAKELVVKPPEGLKANPSLYNIISE